MQRKNMPMKNNNAENQKNTIAYWHWYRPIYTGRFTVNRKRTKIELTLIHMPIHLPQSQRFFFIFVASLTCSFRFVCYSFRFFFLLLLRNNNNIEYIRWYEWKKKNERRFGLMLNLCLFDIDIRQVSSLNIEKIKCYLLCILI